MRNIIKYWNLELIDYSRNHDKFFDIFLMYDDTAGYHVETFNGRNGTVGTRREYRFYDRYDAQEFAEKKNGEKIAKGYAPVRGQPRSKPPFGDISNAVEEPKIAFDPSSTTDPTIAKLIYDILTDSAYESTFKKLKAVSSISSKIKDEIQSFGFDVDIDFVKDVVKSAIKIEGLLKETSYDR